MEIRLSGIEDLLAFVAVIRGEKPDYEMFRTIRRLSKGLDDDATKLLNAENNDSALNTTQGG